jgi:hypothetical protein
MARTWQVSVSKRIAPDLPGPFYMQIVRATLS